MRHSEGVNVEVEILYHPTHFRLRVRDDGRGIDPDVLEEEVAKVIGAFKECANAPVGLVGKWNYGAVAVLEEDRG